MDVRFPSLWSSSTVLSILIFVAYVDADEDDLKTYVAVSSVCMSLGIVIGVAMLVLFCVIFWRFPSESVVTLSIPPGSKGYYIVDPSLTMPEAQKVVIASEVKPMQNDSRAGGYARVGSALNLADASKETLKYFRGDKRKSMRRRNSGRDVRVAPSILPTIMKSRVLTPQSSLAATSTRKRKLGQDFPLVESECTELFVANRLEFDQ